MSAAFKYIFVAIILYYLWNNHIKKMIQVFYKSPSGGGNHRTNYNNHYKQSTSSYRQEEPRVKSRPTNSSPTSVKDFKGGEYVEFEEVE